MKNQSIQKQGKQELVNNVNQYTFTPKVDIWETENGYNLELELPGVDQKGVDVKLEDGVLSILGRLQWDGFEGHEKIRSEYEVGNYERQFQVPKEIDEDNIQATIKNGILSLQLFKREAAKPKRIAVKVS